MPQLAYLRPQQAGAVAHHQKSCLHIAKTAIQQVALALRASAKKTTLTPMASTMFGRKIAAVRRLDRIKVAHLRSSSFMIATSAPCRSPFRSGPNNIF